MPQNYSSTIKQHYHHPLNVGKLANFNYSAEQINPLCGDEIRVYLKIEKLKIEKLSYEARGCMVCIASASVVSEYAKGKKLDKIKELGVNQIAELLDVSISPAREPCAMLAIKALEVL